MTPAFDRAKDALLAYVAGDEAAAERFKEAVYECAKEREAGVADDRDAVKEMQS